MGVTFTDIFSQPSFPNVIDLHQRQRKAWDVLSRQQRIRRATDAYHGRFKKPLKVQPNSTFDDNVILNLARVVVDTGIDFLLGQGISWQITPDSDSPEEIYLADVWKFNKQATKLTQLAQNGALGGHCFVKIQPDEDASKLPRLIILDPAHVEVTPDPHDCETALKYVIQYTYVEAGVSVVYRQTHEPVGGDPRTATAWTIVDEESRDGSSFVAIRPTVSWRHPWPAIVDWQNLPNANEYYGMSDLEGDLLDLGDQINYGKSNAQRIGRNYAHPLTYAVGFNPEGLKTLNPGQIIGVQGGAMGVNPRIEHVEWHGSVTEYDNFAERCADYYFMEARVPRIAAGRVDDIGQLSGEALAILFRPILGKTSLKQETYGGGFEEINQRLLELNGMQRQPEMTTVWPEILPKNVLQESQAYQVQAGLGVVSKETMATRLGYEWKNEAARIERETLGLPPDASEAEVAAARAQAAQQEQQRQQAELAVIQAKAGQSPAPGGNSGGSQQPPVGR